MIKLQPDRAVLHCRLYWGPRDPCVVRIKLAVLLQHRSYLSGSCFSRTSAYSAFTQLLALSLCGAAAMCSQHAAHQLLLTGPGSFARASSSLDSRRGLPPAMAAIDDLQ